MPVFVVSGRIRSVYLGMFVFATFYGAAPAHSNSYSMPTAIVGIPVHSPGEYANIQSVIKHLAREYRLYFYNAKSVPFFAKRCRENPRECQDMYLPPHPRMREGFSLTVDAFSSQCVLVELSEYSGTWTRDSLEAFQTLLERLRKVTGGRALVLVHPKKSQNEAEQGRPYAGPDSERPTYLEELCTRMGVPDPRKPTELGAER